MFKKTKIAAATIALLGAAAAQNVSAVAFDESGTSAQVLIFPYYNTNNGFSTSFNIRNIKDETKAVKLRFRESKISNDVLDFNVYLSPYDHFSVAVTVNDKGQAALSTTDSTCTFPAIPAGGVAFKGNVYRNTVDADAREGYLEVIEMGVIPNSAKLKDGSTGIADSVKHSTSTNKPKDCSVVAKAWNEDTFTEGGANAYVSDVLHTGVQPKNIDRPTGGLAGWSFLLDITNGNAFVANPVAIRNYQTQVSTRTATADDATTRLGAQHYRSDKPLTFLLPSLASGNVTTSDVVTQVAAGDDIDTATWVGLTAADDYATTVIGKAEVKLANGNDGPTASGINPYPIAHVLAATGFTNDYLVDPSNNVGTDWVVTFPMRKHGIYSGVQYSPQASGGVLAFDNPTLGDVTIDATFYNREENKSTVSDDFSPVATSPLTLLPREVNILSFGKSGNSTVSRVLNSAYTKNVGVDFGSGWGDVTLKAVNQYYVSAVSGSSATFGASPITAKFKARAQGVPTIGFATHHGNVITSPSNKTATIGESVPHVFKRNRALPPA